MKSKNTFKEGELLRLVRVRFPGQVHPENFLLGDINFQHGLQVVALSERGVTVGHINSYPFELSYSKELGEINSIIRVATTEDVQLYKEAYQQQKRSREIFNQLVEKHELRMKLTEIDYTAHGKKIVFYYTAPQRVDFRNLLKDLVRELRTTIELVQLPKKSSIKKGIGPCGPELCTFIRSTFSDASKNCSEKQCCLDYDDPFYEEKLSKLPRVGEFIVTRSGDRGRVERLDLWKEEFEMLTDQGILRRYVSEQFHEKLSRESLSFKQFEFIVNETKNVVGHEDVLQRKKRERHQELEKSCQDGKAWVDENFEKILGAKSLSED